jgi:hypothetical protein
MVQTRREFGVSSTYRPKNAMGCSEDRWPIAKRYAPPVRTSASYEIKERPNDSGAHHPYGSVYSAPISVVQGPEVGRRMIGGGGAVKRWLKPKRPNKRNGI